MCVILNNALHQIYFVITDELEETRSHFVHSEGVFSNSKGTLHKTLHKNVLKTKVFPEIFDM